MAIVPIAGIKRAREGDLFGGFHPASSFLVHEIVGKTLLGVDLGEQPRWG